MLWSYFPPRILDRVVETKIGGMRMGDVAREDLIAFLDKHRSKMIDFTCRLVEAPSMVPPGDERQVVSLIQEEMRSLGLGDSRIIAKAEKRPNLMASVQGSSGSPVLLYNAHTDTKPAGNLCDWDTDPLTPTLKDGRLYGLGATDMKGALAAMVYAAAALSRASSELVGDLLLVFSADEEAGSEFGMKYLVEECSVNADRALVGEPCGILESFEILPIASRGQCCFTVKVHGTQMHSSISDVVHSVNAGVKLAKVLWHMSQDLVLTHEPYPYCPQGITINLGVHLEGGMGCAVVPGYAAFTSDVRVLPGMTLERVRHDIEAYLGRLSGQDPDLRVELGMAPPPMDWLSPAEISVEDPLVDCVAHAAEYVLGRRLPYGTFPGATDGRILQGRGGIPSIPAFGPGVLSVAHSANEYVPVEDILQASKIYSLIAYEFLS